MSILQQTVHRTVVIDGVVQHRVLSTQFGHSKMLEVRCSLNQDEETGKTSQTFEIGLSPEYPMDDQFSRFVALKTNWENGVADDIFTNSLAGADLRALMARIRHEDSFDRWNFASPKLICDQVRDMCGYVLQTLFAGHADVANRTLNEFQSLVALLVGFVGKGLDGKAGLPTNNVQYRNSFEPGVGIYSISIPGDPLGEIEVVWGNSRRALLEAEDVSVPIRTTFKQKLSSVAGLYPFELGDANTAALQELKHDYERRAVIFDAIKKVNEVLVIPI